jgi:hypothetical protein
MVTLKVHELRFPHASSAVQVTVVEPTGKFDPDGGRQLTVRLVSQSSVALVVQLTGVPAGSPQAITMFDGQMITGGVVSRMMLTTKLQELDLPQPSVATQVTVVDPIGKGLPGGGTQITLIPAAAVQSSDAVTEYGTSIPLTPAHTQRVILLGQLIDGGCTSRQTSTSNLHWLALPQSSRATQVTVLTPLGRTDPEGGLQTTPTFVEQSSAAVTVQVTGWLAEQTRTAKLLGQLMTGGVVS